MIRGHLYVRAHVARTLVLLLVLIVSFLAACEDPQVSDIKARLIGTWFVESKEHGGIARRVLTVEANGRVKEMIQTVAPSGASIAESREGEWSFDGVNFKRRYTYVDGKPLTNAHFIYETYELRSVTASELVAVSNVGRGELRFKREESGRTR